MKRVYILIFMLITASLFAGTSGEVIAIKGKVEIQKDGQRRVARFRSSSLYWVQV